ncbi:MAG: hypothetical protein U5R06_09620 [candidate division KSB1 bacterium]|nr:hypothetical protein [candidate division KSB1 bacterium]
MISINDKKQALNRLLESSEFCGSNTYKRLLTALVEASLTDEPPKEYNIAVEIFGKSPDFNPAEDSTVRVYISNLRKKLDRYYRTEGSKEKIRLTIPKGHHNVLFIPASKGVKIKSVLKSHYILYGVITVLALSIIVLEIHFRQLRQSVGKDHMRLLNHPVWSDFTQSDSPLFMVLGDDFFFVTKNDSTILRKHSINNGYDFEHYISEHPELQNRYQGQTNYSFVPMISILPLDNILPFFSFKSNIMFQNSSNLKTSDILTNDIIFFGTFRNLYILEQALKDILVNYELGQTSSTHVTLSLGDSLQTLNLNGEPDEEHIDYCLIRKIPGPNQNTLILFISFFETGMAGASNAFTTIESLTDIARSFDGNSFPLYFDVLLKVSGFSRTAFNSEILYSGEIEKTSNFW